MIPAAPKMSEAQLKAFVQLIEDRQETDQLVVTMEYTYALEELERVLDREIRPKRQPQRARKRDRKG
jgi:hypothetical protein